MNTMNRRHFMKIAGAGLATAALAPLVRGNESVNTKPNILFILVDDLDKEWISCYGSDVMDTPNIDQLAAGGMRFENAYCMPQCTPTRATLLTGQYPFRNGWIYHWDVPRWGTGCHFDWRHNLSFGRVMKNAGYKTVASGKWQLSDFRLYPDAMVKHGFDDYCMWTGGEGGNPKSDMRYWDPYIHTKAGSKTYKGQFGPDIFTDFLIEFMRNHREDPMMMYYPMVLTHGPLTTTPHHPNAKTKEEKFKAMVEYHDYLVGKLVQALDDLGLRENTIICYTTDNGTSGGETGSRYGRKVRGGKGVSTENGVNIPFIVNCPGTVPSGVVTNALTDFTDILPTFAALGGATLPDDGIVESNPLPPVVPGPRSILRANPYRIDGYSIADLIQGKTKDSPRKWILAMGSHPGALNEEGWVVPVVDFRDRVIRDKQYKLYVGTDRQSIGLFDLLADPAEEYNLIGRETGAVRTARDKLEAVVQGLPQRDYAPRYEKQPAQSWDRPLEGQWLVKNQRANFLNAPPDFTLR